MTKYFYLVLYYLHQMAINNILKIIKLARVDKNYSQQDMATKLGVSVPTYSRFERGVTKTSYDFVQSVCKVLDINSKKLDESYNIVEEKIPEYGKISSKDEIADGEIDALIELFKKQQEINRQILERLFHLKRKGF